MLHYKNVLSFSVILELFELIQPLMAEGLGWFCLAWRLTCSCFTFSRIRTHFKKSCLLHFNGQWKQDQLIFWAVINNKSWASWGTRMEMHQSVTSKTCLLCSLRICCTWIIFEIYLDALAWILFAKFEINFRNPLIGCQCFDFFLSKSTICASKLTHSLKFCASRITICASRTQWRALDTMLKMLQINQ